MKSYVGLDVHSKSSVFVIQNERGEELGRGEVPTSVEGFSSLRLRFRLRASTLVALESGTMAFFAARKLSELGLSPVVVDAREVRMKAHRPRQKSDTRDAVELCEGLRRGIYRAIVHVPPEKIEHLRNTLSRRRHFVRLGTAQDQCGEKDAPERGALRAQPPASRDPSRLAAPSWGPGSTSAGKELRRASPPRLADCPRAEERVREEPRKPARRLRRRPRETQNRSRSRGDRGADGNRCLLRRHALSDRQACGELRGARPANLPVGRNEPPGPHHQDGFARAAGHARAGGSHGQAAKQPTESVSENSHVAPGTRRAVTAVAHRLCRVLYAMLRDKTSFDRSMLKAHEPRTAVKDARIYRLKTQAAKSR